LFTHVGCNASILGFQLLHALRNGDQRNDIQFNECKAIHIQQKSLIVLFMKTTLLLIIGLIFCSSVFAQTYTLNWASSFSPAWANGATSGNANNIGGSGINCSVSIVKSGGTFASSGGITAPTVANSLVTVPGSGSNILVALDFSNPSQYTDITFNFATLVYNLKFNIADIDRLTNTSNSYFDKITVTALMGLTSVQPVLKKYDAVTDPNFFSISGNVAQVNTTSGMSGNTASDASDQKGTVIVDFNGKSITSFTIRYNNVASVTSDPGVQFIGIGNLSFYKAFPLPVQLASFEGQRGAGENILKWKAVSESKMAYYAIERSKTGKDFSEVGQVESLNSTTATEYSFSDKIITSDNYYYRLKLVDDDGSFSYSKIVLVRFDEPTEIKVFPTTFTSTLTLRIPSSKQETAQLIVVDISGKTVYNHSYKVKQGINEFSIELPASLARGQYFMVIANKNKSIRVIKQ
jgi:hypothetical protein